MPTVNYQLQELQCYQVTSHRLPATKRDIIRQMNQDFKEGGGGNCLIAVERPELLVRDII